MRASDLIRAQRWAILPEWIGLIDAIASRDTAEAERIAADMGRADWRPRVLDMRITTAERFGATGYRRDGVAVIPVTGPMFPRANMMTEMSGATSMQVLGQDLRRAEADDTVRALLLDMDTPGGVAFGPEELAAGPTPERVR